MNVRDWVSRGEEGEEGEGYRAQGAKKHIICQYLKLFTKVNSLLVSASKLSPTYASSAASGPGQQTRESR